MILTREEKTQLLNRFPSLELSYENVLHKKVSADLYMLVPKGQKSFAWFSYWKENNYCFILLINDKNNICDIIPYSICFDLKLSLGTVIYGTLFSNNNLTHFSCEDLFYYKGHDVSSSKFIDKLVVLKEMFDNYIKQEVHVPDSLVPDSLAPDSLAPDSLAPDSLAPDSLAPDSLVLGIPVIKTNYDKAISCINGLSYKIHGVQMYSAQIHGAQIHGAQIHGAQIHGAQNNNILGIYKINKPILPEAIFNVKPLLGADIYELYAQDTTKPYGIACVPSYKSSVMLNSIFRHIKENNNLDLLEESDDEEYENTNISKFVDLDKTYKMRCVYIKKFRKWEPIELVDSKLAISSYKEIQGVENTNTFNSKPLGKVQK
jgi:hypothetical protein